MSSDAVSCNENRNTTRRESTDADLLEDQRDFPAVPDDSEWPPGWHRLCGPPPATIEGLVEYLRVELLRFRRAVENDRNYDVSNKPFPDSIWGKRAGQSYFWCEAPGYPRLRMKGPSRDRAVTNYQEHCNLPFDTEVETEAGVFSNWEFPNLENRTLSLRARYSQISLATVVLENAHIWLDARGLLKDRPARPSHRQVPRAVLEGQLPGVSVFDLTAKEYETVKEWYEVERDVIVAALLAILDCLADPSIVLPDGPTKVGAFRYDLIDYSGLDPLPWRLIYHLWNQSERKALWTSLAGPVWDDHDVEVTETRFGSARSQANSFFEHHGIPYRVKGCKAPERRDRWAMLVDHS